MADQPAMIEIPQSARQVVSERHVQAVAVALRKRWGPCDNHECEPDDDMCHVSMVREVLEQAAALGTPGPANSIRRAVDEAWRVACCYGELTDHLTPHMALSKTHIETVIRRVAPILGGSDGAEPPGVDHG